MKGLQLQMKQLVDRLAGDIMKIQWQKEQENDVEIGPVVLLSKERPTLAV